MKKRLSTGHTYPSDTPPFPVPLAKSRLPAVALEDSTVPILYGNLEMTLVPSTSTIP